MDDLLKEVRKKHNNRYVKQRFGMDGDEKTIPSYFTGWAEITAFVSAAMTGKRGISRIKDPERQKQAIELAEKLSELYFEYT